MTNGAAWIGAVGVAIAGLFALMGAVYTTRTGSRLSHYDQLAKRVLDLENQHDGYRGQITDLEKKDLLNQTKIAGLERKVGAVISDRDDVVGFLVVWREWAGRGMPPPPPPIPSHLRDVIPDWDPADANRALDADLQIARSANDPPDTVGP
jgi:hypothetical protein